MNSWLVSLILLALYNLVRGRLNRGNISPDERILSVFLFHLDGNVDFSLIVNECTTKCENFDPE